MLAEADPSTSSATVVTIERVVAQVEAEWEALVAATGMHPFMRPGWITAYREAFGSGELEVFVARRAGRVVGVLPMQRGRGALTSLSNWHTPEFEPVGVDSDARRVLVAAALRRAPRRLDIAFLPRQGTAEDLVGDESRAAARVLVRTIEHSPFVPIEGEWEAYERGLHGNRRSELRRRLRRLEEAGEVTLRREDPDGDLNRLLDEGFAVEASGWKGEEHTAIAASPDTRLFYTRAAEWAAAEGLLALWFLRVGGKAVAFAFCITDAERHFVLKIGFDHDFARLSPGLLLTRGMLKNAFESGLSSYEFLGGPDPYKLIWTDRCHERERLQLFPRSPGGLAEHLAWGHGRPMAKRLMRR